MNEQLNSAQLQQINSVSEKMVRKAIANMKLRQWAMEQALARIGTSGSAIELAQQIYDFVVKDVTIEIDPDKPF